MWFHFPCPQIPAASLSVFDIVFLVVFIPIFDRVVYPFLDKKGYHLSLRSRIAIGMVIAVLAVACAGSLEMYRLHIYWLNGTENVRWQYIGESFT